MRVDIVNPVAPAAPTNSVYAADARPPRRDAGAGDAVAGSTRDGAAGSTRDGAAGAAGNVAANTAGATELESGAAGKNSNGANAQTLAQAQAHVQAHAQAQAPSASRDGGANANASGGGRSDGNSVGSDAARLLADYNLPITAELLEKVAAIARLPHGLSVEHAVFLVSDGFGAEDLSGGGAAAAAHPGAAASAGAAGTAGEAMAIDARTAGTGAKTGAEAGTAAGDAAGARAASAAAAKARSGAGAGSAAAGERAGTATAVGATAGEKSGATARSEAGTAVGAGTAAGERAGTAAAAGARSGAGAGSAATGGLFAATGGDIGLLSDILGGRFSLGGELSELGAALISSGNGQLISNFASMLAYGAIDSRLGDIIAAGAAAAYDGDAGGNGGDGSGVGVGYGNLGGAVGGSAGDAGAGEAAAAGAGEPGTAGGAGSAGSASAESAVGVGRAGGIVEFIANNREFIAGLALDLLAGGELGGGAAGGNGRATAAGGAQTGGALPESAYAAVAPAAGQRGGLAGASGLAGGSLASGGGLATGGSLADGSGSPTGGGLPAGSGLAGAGGFAGSNLPDGANLPAGGLPAGGLNAGGLHDLSAIFSAELSRLANSAALGASPYAPAQGEDTFGRLFYLLAGNILEDGGASGSALRLFGKALASGQAPLDGASPGIPGGIADEAQRRFLALSAAGGLWGRETAARLLGRLRLDPDDMRALGQASIKRQYAQILESLGALKSATAASGQFPGRAELLGRIGDIENSLRVISELNSEHAYAQIPLMLNGKNAECELYVMKRGGKRKKISPDDATVFIALNTANIGRVEALVRMTKRTSIDLSLRAADGKALELFRDSYAMLYQALMQRGFKLSRVTYRQIEAKKRATPLTAAGEAVREFRLGPPANFDYRV